MSTAIVRQDSVITTLDEMQRVARLLAVSEYFDAKGDNNGAIAKLSTKILAGRELGYGPFTSVNGIHIIQGRPALGANLMAAAVKASGRYDYRVRKIDDTGVEIEFFEFYEGKRESLGVSSFTKKDADTAKTQNMEKFGRNMMFARAMSNGVKWFCPDVFNGNAVYVPEELGAEVDGEGNVIDTTARVILEPPPQVQPEQPAPKGDDERETARKSFMATGSELFGDPWTDARHWLVEAYTTRYTPDNVRKSSTKLGTTELRDLAKMLKDDGTKYVDSWNKYRAKLDAITVNGAQEMAH